MSKDHDWDSEGESPHSQISILTEGNSMNQRKSLTVTQIASATRSDRVMVALPGVALVSASAAEAMQELVQWDCALNILATLAVPERKV